MVITSVRPDISYAEHWFAKCRELIQWSLPGNAQKIDSLGPQVWINQLVDFHFSALKINFLRSCRYEPLICEPYNCSAYKIWALIMLAQNMLPGS